MNHLLNKIVNFHGYLNASPYSIIQSKVRKIDKDISDFFAFRLGDFETIFIAENNLSLLTGDAVECKHIFNFFDKTGCFCGKFEINDINFHYRLNVNSNITNGVLFGGFTHHIQYSKELLENYKTLLADISFQHRGYSGYRRTKGDGYSYVHGNFGGMYIDKKHKIKSIARFRGKHTYTSQFTIKPDYSYDFIFTNPLSKNTSIKFFLAENKSIRTLNQKYLDSHATYMFSLNNFDITNECNISWETSLPIGRCVVFEYNKLYFDVFHS